MIKILTVLLILVPFSFSQNLRIYLIDVEQGASTLFISPSGQTLLVDAGKNGHGSRIQDVMSAAGVIQINHFVCTHYHEDHFGGIDDLVNANTTVQNTYDRGDKASLPASKRSQPTFQGYETAVGNRAIALRPGAMINFDPNISVRCIASNGVVIGENNPTTGHSENDLSVALLIELSGFRYFVGGDIEEATENKIAARDLVTDVDIYQANHHGSNTSSTLAFIQDLIPSVILISNGTNATYQHPRQSTLVSFYDLTPAPVVFQTNKYLNQNDNGGNVSDEFIADLDNAGDDGTIAIEVNQSTGNYSVRYRSINKSYQRKPRANSSSVVIRYLIPNPIGSDDVHEEIQLLNSSNSGINLNGWILQDESGSVWALQSQNISARGILNIKRNGRAMSLNNNGDVISVNDAGGQEVYRYRYNAVAENDTVRTGL